MGYTFDREHQAYLRGQGWSGTHWDSPRDDYYRDRDKWLYDTITELAGDDGELSHDEYLGLHNRALTDRGPWGDHAYANDSMRGALAQAASEGGFRLGQEVLDRYDMTYDGDDILARFDAGDRGPNADLRNKNVSFAWADNEEDNEGNIFRYSPVNTTSDEEDIEQPEEPELPDEPEACPAGQRRDASGDCVDETPYAENPWEEPTKIPRDLKEKRDDWDMNWDPGRHVGRDYERLGSIPFISAGMNERSKPQKYESKFLKAFLDKKKNIDSAIS